MFKKDVLRMNDNSKKLLELEQKYIELSANQFGGEITRDNIVFTIAKHAGEIKDIMRGTNELIDNYIQPYNKNPETLPPELVSEFEELAAELSSHAGQKDTGLAFLLRDILVRYAKHIGDTALYITNLFGRALALFYLQNALFRERYLKDYIEIRSFGARYAEFDKPVRNIIVRAYANVYVAYAKLDYGDFMDAIEETRHFWRHVAQPLDPDFPWEAYFLNIDENMCTASMNRIRSGTMTDKSLIDQVYEATKRLYERAEKVQRANPLGTFPSRVEGFHTEMKYYTGRITFDEMFEVLQRIYKAASNDDYSSDGVYRKFYTSALILEYASKMTKEKRLGYSGYFKQLEDEVLDYARSIPGSVPPSFVTTMFYSFASGYTSMSDDMEFLRVILRLTVCRHMPTYVHSVVVAKLAATLTEFLIEHRPQDFMGMFGLNSISDVEDNQESLVEFAWYCGLVHDIGKISYAHTISLYARRLLDEEFEIIKQHPKGGIEFFGVDRADFSKTGGAVLQFSDKKGTNLLELDGIFTAMLEVSLGHHKSYDGTFGYPPDFDNTKSLFRTIIDVLTVCDSIDAATDVIGRSYSIGKTLEMVIAEIDEGRGTRYSPHIAAILMAEDAPSKQLRARMNQVINEYRYDTYYKSISSGGNMPIPNLYDE